MNYSNIKEVDIADGPGVRVSLFVSGCTHHCYNCFNPETWNFQNGKPYTQETEDELIRLLNKPFIQGLTLLGGEPFEPQNSEALVSLVERIRKELPGKDIWSYSGYLMDQEMLTGKLSKYSSTLQLLKNLDVLVDGEYVDALRDITLKFRGSSNQRIIDVPKSLEAGEILLRKEYM